MQVQEISVTIEEEMKKSYLDYSMSVIIGRALPDVRDGLKPVHRRVLYAMYEQRNLWNRPYRKSARIVGEVIGKYHPHGDASAYDTLVRMAQDFSMRYPLIDGQGNFGSVDGDPPAAMRYTEVRLAPLAGELLEDLEKDTVAFRPNYDESLTEPVVLPTKVPNLLMNGSSGIAVGMATNIPPHNLSELMDALIAIIRDPDCSLEELMNYIPGPDFPTGGFIYGKEGIVEAYRTGKGILQLRARALIEKHPRTGKESIVVTEIPYMTNKAKLVERIAELVRDKKIEGVSDLRDESDKDGTRIVLDLKRDADANVILNQLYKNTPLQTSFGVINLALVNNQPMVLPLKDLLKQFLDFRKTVVTRRCMFDLRKAEERAHILEGLRIALDNLDQVIATIRSSYDPESARARLMEQFGLSQVQAQAILDMRLQRLTALERDKLLDEYSQLIKEISRLKEILSNERLIYQIIEEEFSYLKQTYGDQRRTEIIESAEKIEPEDLIAEEDMVVTVSNTGYIKRNPVSIYRAQQRGGKGKTGMGTKEDDFVSKLFVASTHSFVLVFTTGGRVYWLKVHEVPQGGRLSKGKAIVNLVNLKPGEKISALLPVRNFVDQGYIVMATKAGVVKKSRLSAFSRPRSDGIKAIKMDEGDELIAAELTDGRKDIVLGTREGQVIRFSEEQVRPIGRGGRGVQGIRLRDGNIVVGMEVVEPGATLLTVTENGYGKRTPTEEYRRQSRGGIGIITIKTDERNGKVVAMKQVSDDDELMIVSNKGKIIRIRSGDISIIGRNTKGVRLISLEKDEKVVSLAKVEEKDSENGNAL